MSQGKISKKQLEILEYIKAQILERGFPPALRRVSAGHADRLARLPHGGFAVHAGCAG